MSLGDTLDGSWKRVTLRKERRCARCKNAVSPNVSAWRQIAENGERTYRCNRCQNRIQATDKRRGQRLLKMQATKGFPCGSLCCAREIQAATPYYLWCRYERPEIEFLSSSVLRTKICSECARLRMKEIRDEVRARRANERANAEKLVREKAAEKAVAENTAKAAIVVFWAVVGVLVLATIWGAIRPRGSLRRLTPLEEYNRQWDEAADDYWSNQH